MTGIMLFRAGIYLLVVTFASTISAEEITSVDQGFRVVVPDGAKTGTSSGKYVMENGITTYGIDVKKLEDLNVDGIAMHELCVKSAAGSELIGATPIGRRDQELQGRLVSEFSTMSEPIEFVGRMVYHHMIVVSHGHGFQLRTNASLEGKRAFFDSFFFIGDHIKAGPMDAKISKPPITPASVDGVYRFQRDSRNSGMANHTVHDFLVFDGDGNAFHIEGDWTPFTGDNLLTPNSAVDGARDIHTVAPDKQPEYALNLIKPADADDLLKKADRKALNQGRFEQKGNRVSFSYLNHSPTGDEPTSWEGIFTKGKLILVFEISAEMEGIPVSRFVTGKEFEFVKVE